MAREARSHQVHAQASSRCVADVNAGAIAESAEKLQFLLDHVDKAIFEIDYHGPRVKSANHVTCDKLGYSHDEILHMNPLKLLDQESGRRLLERIRKLMAGEKIDEEVEYTVVKKDGERLLASFNVLMTYRDGKVDGALVIAHDVRKKKIEEALQISEKRFEILFERMSEGFTIQEAIYDAAGRIQDTRYILVNPASERHTGMKASELIGKRNSEVFPDVEPFWSTLFEEVAQTGKPIHITEFFRPLNRWFEISAYKIGPFQFATLLFDITESRQLQEDLQRSTDREHERNLELQTILDTVPAAVFITNDREAKSIVGNKQTYELMRIPVNRNLSMSASLEERPTTVHPYFKGNIIPDYELPMQKAAITGKPVFKQEFELHFTNDRCITLFGNAAPLIDNHGNVRGSVGVFIDITERKKAEEALIQTEKKLRTKADELATANKELESFSYSVAHNLRAPLRSINGLSQILFEDYHENLDVRGKKYLEKICVSTKIMGELIDDMLRLSKVTRSEIKFEPVNLTTLAENIIRNLRETEPKRKVEVNIDPELSCWGDPNLIEITLENLLENAWKFTRKIQHPAITVGKKTINNEPTFFIEDNGSGFDPAYKEKLFRPFERLHGAEDFPGTGIGLAIVLRVIGKHGGKIWAEGTVGEGAKFYFTLPSSSK
jgi:PAS domain S-box-containing protein